MRFGLAVLLLSATCLTPAFGAEIEGKSRIEAVTVYPQGAEVTRVAEAALEAGEHTLILKDFPGELDPQSVRVEGDSEGQIEIASVDTRAVALASDAQDAARLRIENEIQKLQDERSALDGLVADAETRKKLILSMADKQVQPPSTDTNAVRIDAAQLSSLFDLVGDKLAGLSKLTHDAQMRQRDIDQAVEDLQNQLNEAAPEQAAKMEVAIHLVSPAAAKGTFSIRYRVNSAGWQPFYDARLTSPAKDQPARIELVRRADTTQSTGETWDNVALTLSTARPLGATSAPELGTDEIAVYDPKEPPAPVPMAEATEDSGAEFKKPDERVAADGAQPRAYSARKMKISQRQADIQIAGFHALYGIPGRVTVDNTGTSKKVRIDSGSFDAKLVALAVPMIDPTAYLTAAFAVTGETPLLPGTVNLYRDGVFMGQGSFGLLNPGEDAKLGFGADDLIKVKRAEVKRSTGEEGLITTSNTDERAFDISVTNLHDVSMAITLIDRLPFSAHEQVVVEPMSGMTQPETKDVDKRRGVMAWSFELEPKAEKTVKLGYKITWPKELRIGFGGN